MQNRFAADEFLRFMMVSLQGDTGLASGQGGLCLYKQDFAALYTVEAAVVTPDGLERFCSALKEQAEESIHDDMRRRIMRTLVVVPAVMCEGCEAEEKGYFRHQAASEDFKGALLEAKKRCETSGLLVEIAVAEFATGNFFVIGGGKLANKKVHRTLVNFTESNGALGEATFGDDASIEEKLREKKEEISKNQAQTGRIYEMRLINPMTVLILLNVIIFVVGFILELTKGTDPFIMWGIQDNELIRQGEVWRLITPMFLHADWAHLFGNMLTLLYLGRIALDYYTAGEFLAIYGFSGLVGNLLSFVFTDYLSLGASGAIMGLGGMLIYRMFFGKDAKYFRMAGNYAAMVILVLFNLFYGLFAVNLNIDNFGHFGGFLGGFVMAAVIACLRKARDGRVRKGKSQ